MNLRFRWFRALLLFCLLGLAWQALPVRAADEPISLDAYWTLVKESRETVAALVGKSDQDVRAGLSTLAARWEPVRQVRLDGRTVIDIDNSFWVSQFRAETADPAQLVKKLDLLLAVHVTPGLTSPDADLLALGKILARPEFQWKDQAQPDWLQQLWDNFWKWVARILGQSAEFSAPGDVALQVFGVVAALLVALALAYILRGVFSDLAADSMLNPDDGASGVPLNAQSALARAEGLSGQGDYRSAVRYLYLSALLILDERGLLYYDRTRTNREYLRDLKSRPETASLLRAVIDVFDRVWYGFQTLDAETYSRYAEQVNQLKEQK